MESQSESINELVVALAKAQAEFPELDKNREVEVQTKAGRTYKFKYATLDNFLNTYRPILARHEIATTQQICDEVNEEGKRRQLLVTRLIHSSGQWIGSAIPLYPVEDSQAYGSQITYKRRYALAPLLGVAAEEDDDGNRAVGNQAQPAEGYSNKTAPAGGKSPAPPTPTGGAASNPPTAAQGRAAAWQLPPAPEAHEIQNRLAKVDSIAKLQDGLGKLPKWQSFGMNPAAWPVLLAAVRERLNTGCQTEGWPAHECDGAETEFWARFVAIPTAAIQSIHTPEALTTWCRSFLDDYWEGEHEEWREVELWKTVIRLVVERATKGEQTEGWPTEACQQLVMEVKRHQAKLKELAEEALKEHPTDDNQTEATDPADQPAEPDAASEPVYSGAGHADSD